LLQAVDLLLPLGIRRSEGEEVVVVEGEAPGAEPGEAGDGLDDVERRASGPAEGVGAVVADGPQPEAEPVGGGGCGDGHGDSCVGTINVVASNLSQSTRHVKRLSPGDATQYRPRCLELTPIVSENRP